MASKFADPRCYAPSVSPPIHTYLRSTTLNSLLVWRRSLLTIYMHLDCFTHQHSWHPSISSLLTLDSHTSQFYMPCVQWAACIRRRSRRVRCSATMTTHLVSTTFLVCIHAVTDLLARRIAGRPMEESPSSTRYAWRPQQSGIVLRATSTLRQKKLRCRTYPC